MIQYAPPVLWIIGDMLIHGDTYGMRDREMTLITTASQRVPRGLAVTRLLVSIMTFPLLPISLIFVVKTGRSLPDLLCGTLVIKKVEPRGFEVVFPQENEGPKRE